MKKLVFGLLLVLAMVLVPSTAAIAAPGSTDSNVSKDLAQVRGATAKYHDVNAALADGYEPASDCIEVPGLGGMGIHYVNWDLAFGTPFSVDLVAPEILLYVPTNAGPRLVGVEYVTAAPVLTPGGDIIPWFDEDPPPPGFDFLPGPDLFGGPLNGPIPAHEHGEPWHYELHVWLWQGNPNGIFVDFNPNVGCGQS
jgi:hypothetical protein